MHNLHIGLGVVSKDLSFKAEAKDLTFKGKAKDLTSEYVQGPL